MLNISLFPWILLLFSIIGIYGAYLFGKKTKKFRWSEYIAMLIVPVLATLSLSYFHGTKLIYFFITSSFIGFILEYSIGLAYHKTLNKRLWTYDRLAVYGYTSLLTFPMWGIAGVVFWLIAGSFGL